MTTMWSRNILLINTNQKFRDSFEIKRAFAFLYPNKKFVQAFITARSIIYLEFTTPEEAVLFYSDVRLSILGVTRPLRALVTGMNTTAPSYGEFH